MPGGSCAHPDIRKFDGLRCCLACGETVFEVKTPKQLTQTDVQVPYQYTSLNYKLGQEIRLVVLLPGEAADPIRCEIIHVNLEDDPEYDAVSYTWATESGDTSLSGLVHCVHCGYIPITTNCDAALRQLRQRGLRRRVWIDSICIDQTNSEERNHQVGFMDKIYSRARSVRMCIQEHFLSSDWDYGRLFRWLQGFDNSNTKAINPWICTALQHLVSLRYFQRVWVIQEVAFARAAYLLVNHHELLLTSTVMDSLSLVSKRDMYDLPSVLRWNPGQKLEADIFTCLRAGIDCDATDPRDRVFAVLSLMEPYARSLIPVDYTLQVEQVYLNAVSVIIASQRNLEILAYARLVGVVNWQTSPGLTMGYFKRYLIDKCAELQSKPSTDISNRISPLVQFEGESIGPWRSTIMVLTSSVEDQIKYENVSCVIIRPQPLRKGFLPRFRVRAHYIDFVDRSHSFRGYHHASPLRLLRSHKHDYTWTLRFFRRSLPTVPPVVNTPTRFDVLSGVLAQSPIPNANLDDNRSDDLCSEPPIPESYDMNDQLLSAVTQSDMPDINLPDLLTFMEAALARESDMYTFASHHSVGFARQGFKEGDHIFAIDGARAPFILRKTGAQTYRIVGECYLWAALDLDCWNPGTKKGRWDVNFHPPGTEQTQMIEIH